MKCKKQHENDCILYRKKQEEEKSEKHKLKTHKKFFHDFFYDKDEIG